MTDHRLTDEMIDEINEKYNLAVERSYDEDMRAAYDVGYAQALEDVQDVITCIQRKDSPSIPITLNELKDL